MENDRFLLHDGDYDEDGVPVAIVKVKAVRPFMLSDVKAACASYFEEGWLVWELAEVRPVRSTVPVIAARGLYEVAFRLSQNS